MKDPKFWMSAMLILSVGCMNTETNTEPEPTATVEKNPPIPGSVLLPKAQVTIGSTEPADNSSKQSVTVDTFYIDQTEVSAQNYQKCIDAGQCTPPQEGVKTNQLCNYDLEGKKPIAGKENHPINCISFTQAVAYCSYKDKRLPTESEWEYAARGTIESIYPWGNIDPEKANEPLACYGKSDGTCEIGKYVETLLGEKKDLINPQSWVGLYDMAGNVWEWTDTEYQKNMTCSDTCIIKGASHYNTLTQYLRSSLRVGNTKDFYSNDLGFRCAKTAAP